MLSSWDQLFQEAAEFASEIGPDRLINISHSADAGDGVIAIWYWSGGGDSRWQGSEPGSWKSEQ